jgi:hypothetical protein
VLISLAVLPAGALAQGLTVRGRVYDAATAARSPVQNAQVILEGQGATLSNQEGAFMLSGVRPGSYTLRVGALGYAALELRLTMSRDTALALPLTRDPLGLSPLDIVLRRIDFDGRVRDARRGDAWISGAEVTSDQGHDERTNLFGRFDLDDVFDGPLLRVSIRAFRYLPLDTAFVPDHKQRYSFDLRLDSLMDRMIGEYVTRLEVRADPNIHNRYRRPLNREDLTSLSANTTLKEVVERKYSVRQIKSIGCMFLDEREYAFVSDAHRTSVFEGTYVNDIERIELLEFPEAGSMLRVYTRLYFQTHVGSSAKLVLPSMVVTPYGKVLCH